MKNNEVGVGTFVFYNSCALIIMQVRFTDQCCFAYTQNIKENGIRYGVMVHCHLNVKTCS